jgi:hypothetical protein
MIGTRPAWRMLLRPRWLAWHAFAVFATAGMLYLGDWQLHRAESGNELSWAYTFEWPLFAGFGVYFWIKSLRDEVKLQRQGAATGHATAGAVSTLGAASTGGAASTIGAVSTDGLGAIEGLPDSDRVLDGIAAACQRGPADGDDDADPSGAVQAASEAYLARLRAEVRGHGKWHGWR